MPTALENQNGTAVKTQDYSALFWVLLSYQTPMKIQNKVAYPPHYSWNSYAYYYLCPRCNVPIDREYQKYCDRCGQKLDWIS